MTLTHTIHTDRHVDQPHREHTGMVGTWRQSWSWSRAALIGIALGLTGGQTTLADMTRPNMETGGSGAEATTRAHSDTSSEIWTFELPYEQGRPVLVQQPAEDVRMANAAYQNQRSIMLIEEKEAPVAVSTNGDNATVTGDDGNAFSTELIESGSPDPMMMCVACTITE